MVDDDRRNRVDLRGKSVDRRVLRVDIREGEGEGEGERRK